MADSYNGFNNLKALFKESYSDSSLSDAMKTHKRPGKEIAYADKLEKIVAKPYNSKKYFNYIKKKLKAVSK